MAEWVEDVYCRECSAEEVYMDVKEEPSLYKIGAQCGECNYDYGVLDRVSREGISHTDEVYELGEEAVSSFLE